MKVFIPSALGVAILAVVLTSWATSEDIRFPQVLRMSEQPVYGPTETDELRIRLIDRDADVVYPKETRLTVFDSWVRIQEPSKRSVETYDITIIPRSRIREVRIGK